MIVNILPTRGLMIKSVYDVRHKHHHAHKRVKTLISRFAYVIIATATESWDKVPIRHICRLLQHNFDLFLYSMIITNLPLQKERGLIH